MPSAIVVGAAAPEPVEHPDRHQLRPVGEPGQADAVVGLLGDRPGDVGAVAVAVERQFGLVDEVVALDELAGGEVGAAAEAAAERPVGDPCVEDRDRDPLAARVLDRRSGFPRRRPRRSRPGRPAAAGSPGPSQGRKFHCFVTQPPGIAGSPVSVPGSLGIVGSSTRPSPAAADRPCRRGRDVVGRRVLDRRVAAQGGARWRATPAPAGSCWAWLAGSPANLTITWRGANSRARGTTAGGAGGRRARGEREQGNARAILVASIHLIACPHNPCIQASLPANTGTPVKLSGHILADR